MAVPDPEADEVFVGQGEGDLGGAEEVYDLHGEGDKVTGCLSFFYSLRVALMISRPVSNSVDAHVQIDTMKTPTATQIAQTRMSLLTTRVPKLFLVILVRRSRKSRVTVSLVGHWNQLVTTC